MEKKNKNTYEVATFGSGCFWCTEAIFKLVEGVEEAMPGYAGGTEPNPTYELVSSGTTRYAEVVQITYNPDIITYKELLEIFWQTHDPTTLNRQGADVGPQYRSVIFYHNQNQKEDAEYYKDKLNSEGIWEKPIVTEISPFPKFYRAEDYHINYYENNPTNGYCNYVITPKIEKFKKVFSDKISK
jgi:peptide-methionine (S)-S-oxide reductase